MKDFSKLNDLPAEVKLLIVNGQTLVDEVKNKMSDKEYHFDLTGKMQLKNDIKAVERAIKIISKGKINNENIKSLETAIVRLRTSIDGIVNFYLR